VTTRDPYAADGEHLQVLPIDPTKGNGGVRAHQDGIGRVLGVGKRSVGDSATGWLFRRILGYGSYRDEAVPGLGIPMPSMASYTSGSKWRELGGRHTIRAEVVLELGEGGRSVLLSYVGVKF
jgi:hypothetical protein